METRFVQVPDKNKETKFEQRFNSYYLEMIVKTLSFVDFLESADRSKCGLSKSGLSPVTGVQFHLFLLPPSLSVSLSVRRSVNLALPSFTVCLSLVS